MYCLDENQEKLKYPSIGDTIYCFGLLGELRKVKITNSESDGMFFASNEVIGFLIEPHLDGYISNCAFDMKAIKRCSF